MEHGSSLSAYEAQRQANIERAWPPGLVIIHARRHSQRCVTLPFYSTENDADLGPPSCAFLCLLV